jgi:hypothetical protein
VSATKTLWLVGSTHESFGLEGLRGYSGTRLGAQRAANEIARRAGRGWSAYVVLALDAIERH